MVDAFVPLFPVIGPMARVMVTGGAANGFQAVEAMGGVGVGGQVELADVRMRVGVMPVLGVHAYQVEGADLRSTSPPSPVALVGGLIPVDFMLPLGGGTSAMGGITVGYTNGVVHVLNGDQVFGRDRVYLLLTAGMQFGGSP
jgi:hypothetical protein